MQFRSLLLLGFGASLFVSGSVFAAPPAALAPAPDTPEATVVVQAAAAKEEPVKKKKQAAATSKTKKTAAKPMTEQEKRAAKAQADKEKADKARAAQIAKAKAEKEKKAAALKAERDKKVAAAKAEREKKVAAAKVAREKMLAERAKVAEQRKIVRAKAAEERALARAKAVEEGRQAAEARAKASEQQRLARMKAQEDRQAQVAAANKAARQAEIAQLTSMDVVQRGNNGELRSEGVIQAAPKQTGLLAGLFGGQQVQQQAAMLPETRALDAAMEQRAAKRQFNVRPEFVPTVVEFGGYPRGTIVVDTAAHYLYLVEGSNRARRYAIAVGKDGLKYKGNVKVGDKQEWPRWIPTKEMQAREPAKYGRYADGMPGGGQNPLGARAIYLYENGRDTYLRIHGTTAPETIGTDSSNGCFRMINEHVIDLYRRVPVGTQVVVL